MRIKKGEQNNGYHNSVDNIIIQILIIHISNRTTVIGSPFLLHIIPPKTKAGNENNLYLKYYMIKYNKYLYHNNIKNYIYLIYKEYYIPIYNNLYYKLYI